MKWPIACRRRCRSCSRLLATTRRARARTARATCASRGRSTGVWTSAFFLGQFVTPLVVGPGDLVGEMAVIDNEGRERAIHRVPYGTVRTETFVPYWLGKEQLFNDRFGGIALGSEETASGYDFGELGGELGGFVYVDRNGNGQLNDETPSSAIRRESSMVHFDPIKLVFKGCNIDVLSFH